LFTGNNNDWQKAARTLSDIIHCMMKIKTGDMFLTQYFKKGLEILL
jgi:hypothetical protein